MKPTTTKSVLLLYGGMPVLLAVTTTTTATVYAQFDPTPTPAHMLARVLVVKVIHSYQIPEEEISV